jgi:hypothetical protein
MKDIRKIKKIGKNGNVIKVIEVDWNKLPCSKCERRYHFTCPKDCWNKKRRIRGILRNVFISKAPS